MMKGKLNNLIKGNDDDTNIIAVCITYTTR
jgi:hypothetical protein